MKFHWNSSLFSHIDWASQSTILFPHTYTHIHTHTFPPVPCARFNIGSMAQLICPLRPQLILIFLQWSCWKMRFDADFCPNLIISCPNNKTWLCYDTGGVRTDQLKTFTEIIYNMRGILKAVFKLTLWFHLLISFNDIKILMHQ